MANRASQGVMSLLDKMNSPDADFRYMALNDLISTAQSGMLSAGTLDERTETATIHKVLDLIKDPNGEVKNMTVKCIGVLVKTLREKQMQLILDKLIEYMSSKDEELRDIASLGLKTVMTEIPAGSSLAATAASKLVPRLLGQIGDPSASQEHVIDSLDVLADFFVRFAPMVANDIQLQQNALKVLTNALTNNRAAIRKRSVLALSALAASATSEIFTALAESIAKSTSASKPDITKTYTQLLGALSKTCPRRLGRRLPEFMPRILAIVNSDAAQEDDEMREACLQTLESIVLRCPKEVTPFVSQIVQLAITLLRHDPNYAGGDTSDDEMAVEGDDEMDDDDDFLGEDGYSDDEDLSWKVRRASAKLLASVITTRSELLANLTANVAPALVSRFSEREESVRNEILSTFTTLLRQIRLFGLQPQATEVLRQSPGALKRKWDADGTDVDAEGDTLSHVRALVPSIVKALAKEIASKSASTRLASYIVLQELIKVLHGGLGDHVGLLVGQMDRILKGTDSVSGSANSVKTEILTFLQLLFSYHEPSTFDKYLDQLVPYISSTIEDKVHRDAVEGLQVTSALVRVLRPLTDTGNAGHYAKYVVELFSATTKRLTRSDSDQEIKEKGIATLGDLLCHAGDDLSNHLHEALTLLLERIQNEVTRYAAVRVTSQVVTSPVCKGAEMTSFCGQALQEVTLLLRKNNRLLRTASFECLIGLLTRLQSDVGDDLAEQVVREIEPLLAHDSNYNLAPAALQSLEILLKSRKVLGPIVDTMVPHIHSMVQSPLLQGPSLKAVLSFVQSLLVADSSSNASLLSALNKARQEAKSSPSPTHVYSTIARVMGAIGKIAPEPRQTFVEQAGQALNSSASDSDKYFELHVMGELGRTQDFGADQSLLKTIASFYESPLEEVRNAAAFAIGNMAVGSLEVILPMIEEQLREERSCRLALLATKELISHGSKEQLDVVAEHIWTSLFDICATKDEAVRNVGAECLARLTVTQPERYLPQLQSRIHDPVATTRATVISAIRFTLTDTRPGYDELLAPSIVDFLSLLKDESLDVRKPAMFAFNAAAHNRPSLIRSHLDVLMPMLFQETVPRPELLRKVAMGPFTVTTDDGLDLRKNAFETMYTLLDTCFARINLNEYIERVIAGLKDEDGIKVLSSLMLVRLASLAPAQTGQYLDDVVEPITSTLKVKLKDQATKQDVEKSTELQRSLFRAMVALDRTPHTAPKFQALKRDARHSSPLYREVEASFHEAAAGQRDLLGYGSALSAAT